LYFAHLNPANLAAKPINTYACIVYVTAIYHSSEFCHLPEAIRPCFPLSHCRRRSRESVGEWGELCDNA